MLGEGGTVGDEADAADDQDDAQPAVEGDGLVQPEAGEQGDDDVAEGGGGQDEGEVGPAERGEIAAEEADQEDDAGDDPGVLERDEQHAEMVQGDGADLGHAVREERVSDRGGEHDGEQDEVALRGECVLHVVLGFGEKRSMRMATRQVRGRRKGAATTTQIPFGRMTTATARQ